MRMGLLRAGLVVALLVFRAAVAGGQEHSQDMEMSGPLGERDSRRASGTAWMPDESPSHAVMVHKAGWMLMVHGQLFGHYVRSFSVRGDDQFGSTNWIMAMAQHDVGGGQLTGRAMFSLDRLTVGVCGYPDIGQTRAKCGSFSRDYQHPHDLFMEVGADYRRAVSDSVAFELYGGPSGEPALGPPGYPHRLSSLPNPIAPIGHHWLDLTHVTFGVVTAGVYGERWKGETSLFNGRHSDEERYGFDLAPLTSISGRGWWMPSPRWAVQASTARLRAPEGHNHSPNATDLTTVRTTASATYHRLEGARLWATTVAWGQNRDRGVNTDALLAETAFDLEERDTVFGRAELVEKTNADINLGSLDVLTFTMAKLQAGYMRTLATLGDLEASVGGTVGVLLVPANLEFVYGGRATGEFSLFFSIRPRRAN